MFKGRKVTPLMSERIARLEKALRKFSYSNSCDVLNRLVKISTHEGMRLLYQHELLHKVFSEYDTHIKNLRDDSKLNPKIKQRKLEQIFEIFDKSNSRIKQHLSGKREVYPHFHAGYVGYTKKYAHEYFNLRNYSMSDKYSEWYLQQQPKDIKFAIAMAMQNFFLFRLPQSRRNFNVFLLEMPESTIGSLYLVFCYLIEGDCRQASKYSRDSQDSFTELAHNIALYYFDKNREIDALSRLKFTGKDYEWYVRTSQFFLQTASPDCQSVCKRLHYHIEKYMKEYNYESAAKVILCLLFCEIAKHYEIIITLCDKIIDDKSGDLNNIFWYFKGKALYVKADAEQQEQIDSYRQAYECFEKINRVTNMQVVGEYLQKIESKLTELGMVLEPESEVKPEESNPWCCCQ